MRITILSCCLAVAALAGCSAEPNAHSATASTQPHAECLVCKANADLACVDIPVDGSTPSYAYNGRCYYFCSDECRNKFAKSPSNYAAK